MIIKKSFNFLVRGDKGALTAREFLQRARLVVRQRLIVHAGLIVQAFHVPKMDSDMLKPIGKGLKPKQKPKPKKWLPKPMPKKTVKTQLCSHCTVGAIGPNQGWLPPQLICSKCRSAFIIHGADEALLH